MKIILFTCAAFILLFASMVHQSQRQSGVQTSPKSPDTKPTVSGYILGPEEGDALWNHLIKVDPARGSMRLGMGIQSLRAGRGIALHMHEGEDEILFIHQGMGKGVVGKEQKQLTPGTTLYIPQGVWHGVQNTSEGMKVLWVVSPPNYSRSLRDIYALEKSGREFTDDERQRIAFKHGQKDARYFLAEVLARSIWDGGQDWGKAEFDAEGLTANYTKDGRTGKLIIRDSSPDGLGFQGEWLNPDESKSSFVMHYDFDTGKRLTIKWGHRLEKQTIWQRVGG
jgi:mannose-6-phosphate isomerase-like protein (cupin superfamily)